MPELGGQKALNRLPLPAPATKQEPPTRGTAPELDTTRRSGASSSPGPTPTEVGGVAGVRVHGGLRGRGCRLGV